MIISVAVDDNILSRAREVTGGTDQETVALALKTLIALRTQSAAVERIIGRRFTDDQLDAPTVEYPDQHGPAYRSTAARHATTIRLVIYEP
jgi:hypothetical protein